MALDQTTTYTYGEALPLACVALLAYIHHTTTYVVLYYYNTKEVRNIYIRSNPSCIDLTEWLYWMSRTTLISVHRGICNGTRSVRQTDHTFDNRNHALNTISPGLAQWLRTWVRPDHFCPVTYGDTYRTSFGGLLHGEGVSWFLMALRRQHTYGEALPLCGVSLHLQLGVRTVLQHEGSEEYMRRNPSCINLTGFIECRGRHFSAPGDM